ncbi:TetR/AcrR family transcriptional regulator [Agrobacterium vitis]|uniref:TetR family transcriptional regulator n=2 Tax=Agrobacterium vitis TaxID=373 RepID=A0AAE4WHW3_AGRVI|nr:TetR/AcrR family transcriptional regulator [Allorhizobium sp. Av2]MCM2442721.1 TetR/AcrR family transcriptional regulator [Agrobacterium vitis]MUZ60320.1 TetR family transcriptional regulator [Agrobacterium vitis]MVA68443.1 TetR family transcriptional regulator [Agrobacterium vitis]MVA88873.1 TetR family transcriptional regulator [Agrobacterium vitis]
MVMAKRLKTISRAEQKARRPQEILEAAFEEFLDKGFAAARVEDVALRLGITKGTVYLYFPSKEVLFEETIRQMSLPLSQLRASAEILEGSHAERLKQMIGMAYEMIAGDCKCSELLRLTVSEGTRFPHIVDRHYDEFVAPLLKTVCTLVEGGVAAGEFLPGPAASAPDVLIGPIIHFNLWSILFAQRRPLEQKAYMEAHVDMVMRTLMRGKGE